MLDANNNNSTDDAQVDAPKTRRSTRAPRSSAAKAEASTDGVAPTLPFSSDETASAPPRRTRKKATDQSVVSESSAAPDSGDQAPGLTQEGKADTPARRTTRRRVAAPSLAESESTPQDEAAQSDGGPQETNSFAPKGRGRRTRTPASEAAARAESQDVPDAPAEQTHPSSAPSDDPIGEALNELGRTRRNRNRRPAIDTNVTAPTEVLHELAEAIASDESESGSSEEGEDTPRRRRRRRGGRNHRRNQHEFREEREGDADTEEVSAEVTDELNEGDDEGEEDGSRHHRRRRRRRGEESGDDTAADSDVVVKVREPRSSQKAAKNSGDVTGIDGSTRLEAKKQRRREGRTASRRRVPILSEAEFLTRRESVERLMLIRQKQDYSQIAVVEDGMLVEHYVDRASATSLIGNIYLGKVQNVLPGMEAAFIDIGRGRNAVLYAGEVDWDSFGEAGANRKIEEVFTAGQLLLVQVSKDPVGAKGARLTSHVSIPGRYIVYAPQGHISGISRKLSEIERNRLKSILDSLVGDKASVVIRTAAEGASEEELVRDINRLKAQWEVIEKKSTTGKQSPQLLYAEPDLTMRIVRDLFTEDFTSLIVDGNGGMEDAYDLVEAYVKHVAPHLSERIAKWDHDEKGDLFANYRIDEQIAKALDRKVHLPSGGSLVIDRTEAMTVIDVNTGKFTGSGGNLEATVTANNLEAAEEIVRQLRLRDIGGIIIVDFIDMVLSTNRELLLRRLIECLSRDRTRHQVSEVTSLGLVQLTRKKVGTGLAEAFTQVCEVCGGEGHIRYEEPVDTQAPADGGERHARTTVPRGRRKS